MNHPIKLGHLIEFVEAAKAVYLAGSDATTEQMERLNEAMAPVSWRVRELAKEVNVEIIHA